MKRRSIFLICAALIIVCMACEKKLEASKPTIHEVAERIYTSENFMRFTRNFIADFTSMASYYRSVGLSHNRGLFIGKLKEAGEDEAKLQSAFSAVSISLDEGINRKNRVDNDLLLLFNQERILLKHSETEVWTIIREAIDLGWRSEAAGWQEVRAAAKPAAANVRVMADQPEIGVKRLEGPEVWGCVKEAVGVGSASILGIAGLQKLASEGIQKAVTTLSGWLARRAGWIGAAIMLMDFTCCMYSEYYD